MRLDKYLKVSRLIKRRTLAKEASEAERVLINDLPAKPSKEVKIGDLTPFDKITKEEKRRIGKQAVEEVLAPLTKGIKSSNITSNIIHKGVRIDTHMYCFTCFNKVNNTVTLRS